VQVSFLWADAISALASVQISRAGLVSLYPSRADAPPELWRDLFGGAQEATAVIAYAAIFLFEQNPDLPRLLADKAESGCRVRLALGDVDSDEVRRRGEEEHFGLGIDSRVSLALKHLEPILDQPGVEIRLHRTTLYNSLFRFDDQILVNTHLWGMSAFQAPLLHLRRGRRRQAVRDLLRQPRRHLGRGQPPRPGGSAVRRTEHYHDPEAPRATSLVPATSAVVFDADGRVLLHRRADNRLWSLPGGAMEIGETVKQCVMREVLEETGLEIRTTGLVGIYSDPDHVIEYEDGEVRQQFSICFRAVPVSGELRSSSDPPTLPG
jgi:ADP-ribose pyrophosphatase YjhB (NUDIX family)